MVQVGGGLEDSMLTDLHEANGKVGLQVLVSKWDLLLGKIGIESSREH